MGYTYGDLKKSEPERKTQPWFNAFLFNAVIKPLTLLVANHTSLTARAITGIGFLFTLASAWFFFQGNLVLGACLYIVRHIADYIDGKIARLKNNPSRWGTYLDSYTGKIGFGLNVFALTYHQFAVSSDMMWLILCSLILFLFPLHSWESSRVSIIIGKDFKDAVVGKKEVKSKSMAEKIKSRLIKYDLLEPFNVADMAVLMLFAAPIIAEYAGYLKGMFIALTAILILKTIFWFFYYASILRRMDKEKKAPVFI